MSKYHIMDNYMIFALLVSILVALYFYQDKIFGSKKSVDITMQNNKRRKNKKLEPETEFNTEDDMISNNSDGSFDSNDSFNDVSYSLGTMSSNNDSNSIKSSISGDGSSGQSNSSSYGDIRSNLSEGSYDNNKSEAVSSMSIMNR